MAVGGGGGARGDSFTLQSFQFASFSTVRLFLPYLCITLIIFMSVVCLGGEIMALLLLVSVLFLFLFCLSSACLAAYLSLSLTRGLSLGSLNVALCQVLGR